MQHIKLISEITHKHRNKGYSSWLLKSIINSPRCAVICQNKRAADAMKQSYYQMLELTPGYKKWRIEQSSKGVHVPKFYVIDDPKIKEYILNLDMPIIFDNGVFL